MSSLDYTPETSIADALPHMISDFAQSTAMDARLGRLERTASDINKSEPARLKIAQEAVQQTLEALGLDQETTVMALIQAMNSEEGKTTLDEFEVGSSVRSFRVHTHVMTEHDLGLHENYM